MDIKKNNDSNGRLFVELIMRQYINGTDIKTICEKFLRRIDADSNPEHKGANEERRKVLNNCIVLFDDPKTQEQIDHIKGTENFKDIFSLMKRILTEFHQEIFGVDKRIIAEYIIQKYLKGNDINKLSSRLLKQISEDSNPEHSEENEECKKIVQNCLTLLQDPKIIHEIEQIRESENLTDESSLIQRIKSEYFEKIFNKDKRTYDMSKKYNPKAVTTVTTPSGLTKKVMEFRYAINDSVTYVQDEQGDEFLFEKVGRLAYHSQLRGKKFIDKYRVYKNNEFLCEIFTRLIPSKLLSDIPYRRAVINELLSSRSLENAEANSGYVGEIEKPSFTDEKIPVGKQEEISELFCSLSKYGYSELYDFVFDYDTHSAVRDFQQEQQQSTGTANKKNTGR